MGECPPRSAAAKAQAEMEAAALAYIREAELALGQLARKADPEAFDRARARLRDAKTAYRSVRIFGPNALEET